ncbi:hypothetical protein [Lentzea sp. CA-135723]|uniref:hypothetical protein n=1 Tax=Lentzea sp. CA-135723 TaxID=3239950 RepID=UPI003D942CE9
MASEPVTAGQYPELAEHELVSKQGVQGGFVGRVVEQNAACGTCGRTDATVYQGPQHGLAHDVPVDGGFTTAPVDLQLTWCPACGPAAMRLVGPDGTEHTGW